MNLKEIVLNILLELSYVISRRLQQLYSVFRFVWEREAKKKLSCAL